MTGGTVRVTRSRFITGLAWFGMVSGAMASLGACLMCVVSPSLGNLVFLVSSVGTLVTSVGLRNRREWARRGMIALLAYSTLAGLLGAIRTRAPDASALTGDPSLGVAQADLDAAFGALRPVFIGGALVIGLLNGLIIVKLCTTQVRAEFAAEAVA